MFLSKPSCELCSLPCVPSPSQPSLCCLYLHLGLSLHDDTFACSAHTHVTLPRALPCIPLLQPTSVLDKHLLIVSCFIPSLQSALRIATDSLWNTNTYKYLCVTSLCTHLFPHQHRTAGWLTLHSPRLQDSPSLIFIAKHQWDATGNWSPSQDTPCSSKPPHNNEDFMWRLLFWFCNRQCLLSFRNSSVLSLLQSCVPPSSFLLCLSQPSHRPLL